MAMGTSLLYTEIVHMNTLTLRNGLVNMNTLAKLTLSSTTIRNGNGTLMAFMNTPARAMPELSELQLPDLLLLSLFSSSEIIKPTIPNNFKL